MIGHHIGCAWTGHDIEDECPCEQAPCGLAIADTATVECRHHHFSASKTIRQAHTADQCPGADA